MTTSPNPPQGRYCEDCQAHRLHRTRLSGKKKSGAKRVHVLACTVCERETALPPKESPGIPCPICGDVRLAVVHTRHRTRQTVRIKRCRTCGHRVRTRETVESYSA